MQILKAFREGFESYYGTDTLYLNFETWESFTSKARNLASSENFYVFIHGNTAFVDMSKLFACNSCDEAAKLGADAARKICKKQQRQTYLYELHI